MSEEAETREEVMATTHGSSGETGQGVAVGAVTWLDSGHISYDKKEETRGSANGPDAGCGTKHKVEASLLT